MLFRSTQKSFLSKNDINVISGEDWQSLNYISVNSNNTDLEYSYSDNGYVGYSNESSTRYKFLYTDSGNSVEKDFISFEIPFELEAGNVLKYRIARKSEPLGFYDFPQITNDGKAIVDYSKYKNEISGSIGNSLSYDFGSPYTISMTQEALENILNNDQPSVITIPDFSNSQDVNALSFSKEVDENNEEFLKITLLANENFDNIIKLNLNIERFKSNSKIGVGGYVMSEYKMGDGYSTKTISLAAGSQDYPRILEDGSSYGYGNVSSIVDAVQVIESEKNAQDLQARTDGDPEDQSKLEKGVTSYFENITKLLEDDGDGGFPADEVGDSETEDIITQRIIQDNEDQLSSISQNSQTLEHKVNLQNLPLPKKTYTSDYFSNYLNSGEEYVITPFSNYSLSSIFASCGDRRDSLGYFIKEDKERAKATRQPYYRFVLNTTCDGLYINSTSFCKGDSAIYDNASSFEDGSDIKNGLVTEIPSDGIIIKDNYAKPSSWENAINYFYTKNYISTFTVQPSYSETEYLNLFTLALSN